MNMAAYKFKSKVIQTEVIPGAKFFNGGIRKTTDLITSRFCLENLTQSLLYSINLKDAWVLIGGDGRSDNKVAIERIIQVLSGNSIRKVFVALNGHLPTPLAAYVLRQKRCHLGFLLTGGHHVPGKKGYLGLKIISPPGIPIREEVTNRANRIIKYLQSYNACDRFLPDFSSLGETEYIISGIPFSIDVIDVTSPYVEDAKKMFDFPSLKDYIKQHLSLLIDCSNGVTGFIVKRIFVDELGMEANRIINSNSLEDFGNLSPEPVEQNCKVFLKQLKKGDYPFGAIINPDGCRCLIVDGEEGFMVPPSDSLAIIAEHNQCIPFFQENKLQTVIHTVCTSKAVDQVAESLSLVRTEIPVGWEHTSSAMVPAKGKAILFGEESYGVGASSENFFSDRDGIWAVLAWLSILASCKKRVKEVTEDHWRTFGRSFFGRWDFPNISAQQIDTFLCHLKEKNCLRFDKIRSETFFGTQYIDPIGIDPKLQTEEAKKCNSDIVYDIENYVYPYGFMKKSLLADDKYQNYQIKLMDNARLVLRRSRSISSSTTLRFYIEYRVKPEDKNLFEDRAKILARFIKAAMKITGIHDIIPSEISPVFV